jgi:hypothetical protein
LNVWFNLGFTWSLASGLKVVLDAKVIGEKAASVAQTNVEGTNTFAIRNDAGVKVELDVYNLAVWHSVTPDGKLTNLVGMKGSYSLHSSLYLHKHLLVQTAFLGLQKAVDHVQKQFSEISKKYLENAD